MSERPLQYPARSTDEKLLAADLEEVREGVRDLSSFTAARLGAHLDRDALAVVMDSTHRLAEASQTLDAGPRTEHQEAARVAVAALLWVLEDVEAEIRSRDEPPSVRQTMKKLLKTIVEYG